MALRWLAVAVLATLGACSVPRGPDTNVLGAGPACDLRIDVGADHRCVMTHVAPAGEQQLISNSTHVQEPGTLAGSAPR